MNVSKALFLVLALLVSPVWAATLVSDYQAHSLGGEDYGAADIFEWSADGGETWVEIGNEVADDSLMFRVFEPFDVTSVGEWLIRAKNTYWGRVSTSVPFVWGGEGPLPAPTGFRVIP